MKKQANFPGTSISISLYSDSGSEALFEFEARHGRKLEMAKVTTKEHISKLLNNGYHGSQLVFAGIDAETQKFFRHCAGV